MGKTMPNRAAMLPLVDIHCHLLAGLDDGPRTLDDAQAMCALAQAEGVGMMSATAHQNERWSDVTPERIRQATAELRQALAAVGNTVQVFPCAEVMAAPQTVAAWRAGSLLTVGDRGQYILLEMPRGVFVDLRPTVQALRQAGVGVILAHPERESDFLHVPGLIEELIVEGCLVQVSSSSVTEPRKRADVRALQQWFRRGIVHLLGSDGHSVRRRPPLLAAAYQRICQWAGTRVADRVCRTHGMAVLHGLPLHVPEPAPPSRRWWWLPAWG
jgi:protein-tyrosine phosphatase